MNIVVSGCSNSCNDPYEHYRQVHGHFPCNGDPLPWPAVLADITESSVTNLSYGGKGNNRIFADLIDNIATNWTDIDVVIVQLTVPDRISYWRSVDASWNNRLSSSCWIPMSRSCGDRLAGYKPTIRDGIFVTVGQNEGKELIGDIVNSLLLTQFLCEQYGIQLVVVNWFNIPCLTEYPAASLINTDNWLMTQGSIYDYILSHGYKSYDDGHFNNDAHHHIAHLIKTFIDSGIRPASDSPIMNPIPIYNYT